METKNTAPRHSLTAGKETVLGAVYLTPEGGEWTPLGSLSLLRSEAEAYQLPSAMKDSYRFLRVSRFVVEEVGCY